jgi:hypothetical protein
VTAEKRLTTAASSQGKAAAGVVLPSWPDDCRIKAAHAALREGDEARSVLIRERSQLDQQNARTNRCAGFYDDLKRNYRIDQARRP